MTAPRHEYEWLDVPAGEYEIGLRDEEAWELAVIEARRTRRQIEDDPDPLHGLREAFEYETTWGDPEYLFSQLAHCMPAHRVALASFSMTATPVTLRDWTEFRIATGAAPRATSSIRAPSQLPTPDEPVTGLSWDEACAFAKWSGAELPRECEWEVALRPTRSPFGTIGHELFEWCADEFAPYRGAAPPEGPHDTRTRRGGAIPGFSINVVGRRGADPRLRLCDTTFRLVRRHGPISAHHTSR
jgi:formylglycine-generating enzyme required for sulfatase activity